LPSDPIFIVESPLLEDPVLRRCLSWLIDLPIGQVLAFVRDSPDGLLDGSPHFLMGDMLDARSKALDRGSKAQEQARSDRLDMATDGRVEL